MTPTEIVIQDLKNYLSFAETVMLNGKSLTPAAMKKLERAKETLRQFEAGVYWIYEE